MIQQSFIDMENMFDLFQQKRQVLSFLFLRAPPTHTFCGKIFNLVKYVSKN